MKRIASCFRFLSLLLCGMAAAVLYYFMRPLRAGGVSVRGVPGKGWSVCSLTSAGRQRVYMLYAPQQGMDRERPTPLVIGLVGFGANPTFHRYVSRWERVADQYRFLVAYPQGSSFPLHFNAGPVYKIPAIDDVQLIRDLIAEIDRFFKVDRQRVYINGMSGGSHD